MNKTLPDPDPDPESLYHYHIKHTHRMEISPELLSKLVSVKQHAHSEQQENTANRAGFPRFPCRNFLGSKNNDKRKRKTIAD